MRTTSQCSNAECASQSPCQIPHISLTAGTSWYIKAPLSFLRIARPALPWPLVEAPLSGVQKGLSNSSLPKYFEGLLCNRLPCRGTASRRDATSSTLSTSSSDRCCRYRLKHKLCIASYYTQSPVQSLRKRGSPKVLAATTRLTTQAHITASIRLRSSDGGPDPSRLGSSLLPLRSPGP